MDDLFTRDSYTGVDEEQREAVREWLARRGIPLNDVRSVRVQADGVALVTVMQRDPDHGHRYVDHRTGRVAVDTIACDPGGDPWPLVRAVGRLGWKLREEADRG